jgi:N-acyl-D-amino-acid deacylase
MQCVRSVRSAKREPRTTPASLMRKLFIVLAALFALAVTWSQPSSFDVLITGGKIIDGTGNPWFIGDVGISGDTIVAIGRLGGSSAKLRIDATGLAVAPGFIDLHSHAARFAERTPALESAVRQGQTTAIDNPDGGSAVPLRPFLDRMASLKTSINFGFYTGQGSIRSKVIGLVNRSATSEEIARMRELAREDMYAGAFGLSTGLFYVPGNYTPTEEVIEIAKVVAGLGGMHISHMRDEAANVVDSVRETIRIGEEGGLPTQVTHHKVTGKPNWGASEKTLKLVEEARSRGVDVTMDQYPYTASHTGSAALFPQWSLEGGAASLRERLGAPEQRARIKTEIVRRIRDDRGAGDPKNVQFARCDHDPALAGRTLADATRARGLEPTIENAAEVAIEIQLKGGCSTIYHAMSEEDVVRILRHPLTMIASDGEAPVFGEASPHPRAYGTFPRVLGRYVREKNVIALEDAIRKMTSFPASRLKLYDRGVLRAGMKADVVVFDPATIADKSEFIKPHQYSVGIREVFVNGEAVLLGGKMTNARPGRVLYGPARK